MYIPTYTVTFPNSIYGSFYVGKQDERISDFKPERITFSGLTTVVFWKDNSKTIVKCSCSDVYDREHAVAMAIAHKMFGSKNQFKKFVSSGYVAMTLEEEENRKMEKSIKKLEEKR
jgi:hypothetical protein